MWTPESNAILPTLSLSGIGYEESLMKLWQEFLAGWFSDSSHELQEDVDVRFPAATLAFQEMESKTGLEGLGISVVLPNNDMTRPVWEDSEPDKSHRHLRNWLRMEFIIRAVVKAKRDDGQNSKSLCRLGSDLLYSLLLNKPKLMPLNRAGVLAIRPRPPRWITSGDYPTRGLSCRMQLHFPVTEQIVVGSGSEVVGSGHVLVGA